MSKILLIDDDDLVRYALNRYLTKEGFEVETLPSGKNLLKTIENFEPDLIITDIIMPEVEGIEIITLLKMNESKIPVIAISGGSRNVDTSYLEIAKELGAYEVLEKPIDEEKLLRIIKELVNKTN